MLEGLTTRFMENVYVSSRANYRLLALDGNDGTVYCRVHGYKQFTPIPSFSENWVLEFATRSYMRLINLTAFRGDTPDTSMVGPGDYYANLEKPHKRTFTITIENGFPTFHAHLLADEYRGPTLRDPTQADLIKVKVNWVSGKQNPRIGDTAKKYQQEDNPNITPFGNSLFPDSGILEFDTPEDTFTLPAIDATQINLSTFNARLVRNDQPFRIIDTPIDSSNEYRPVSYDFGKDYAEHCVTKGGGLFLETHRFTQTMTPLDASCGGFITLGRWCHDKGEKSHLELIAVKIPYNYTLLVDRGCIHGDTTFKGNYMMSMTSNHITMQSADTVFLKHKASKKNIRLLSKHDEQDLPPRQSPKPVALYGFTNESMFKHTGVSKGDPNTVRQSEEDFRRTSRNVCFIYQPKTKNYARSYRVTHQPTRTPAPDRTKSCKF